jgi:hypothetical protein
VFLFCLAQGMVEGLGGMRKLFAGAKRIRRVGFARNKVEIGDFGKLICWEGIECAVAQRPAEDSGPHLADEQFLESPRLEGRIRIEA